MPDITIPLPKCGNGKTAEITIEVSCKSTRETFKVMMVSREEESEEGRIQRVQQIVDTETKEWQLITIGDPGITCIPILFRHRDTTDNPTNA